MMIESTIAVEGEFLSPPADMCAEQKAGRV